MERLMVTSHRWRNALVIVVLLLGLLPTAQDVNSPSFEPPVAHAQEATPTPPAEVTGEPTPSPTVEAETPTPTVAITDTVTPTSTAEATPTPTVVTGASSEPSSSLTGSSGQLLLTKLAEPVVVSPGDLITYTIVLTNTTGAVMERLVVSDTLPDGLAYLPGNAEGGVYDPRTATLTWDIRELAAGASLSLTFQARVRGDVLADLVVNLAEVMGGGLADAIKAQATVAVVGWAVITPQEGGVLVSPCGRVRVEFPPGAVAASIWAHYAFRSAERLAAHQAGLAFTFDLRATDQAEQAVTRFAKPLTVTLALGDLVNWAQRPDFLRPWVAYLDEVTSQWVTITPTRLDEQAGVVAFTTDHLSIFGAGTTGVPHSGWLLNFNDTRVDRFGGALTWAYDFDPPSGPGGVRPTLRLSYNSRRLDGVLTWAQSDGMGWGWNLDAVEVLWRNVRRCWDGANHYLCWDAVPLLVLNGEALKLVPETAMPANHEYLGHSGSYRYRSEDDRFWRVEWKSGAENGYWEVTLRDGTLYRLGTTSDSRQVLWGWIGGWTGFGWLTNQSTVRWRLKEIVYPTGVTVTYTYTEQNREQQCNIWKAAGFLNQNDTCHGDEADSERASYLTEITYPGARVRLIWDRRWNGNGPNDGFGVQAYRWDFAQAGMAAIFWQTDALQKVVLERQKPDGTWAAVREWRLTYDTYIPADEGGKRLRILVKFQEWSPQGSSLPPFTFGYQGYRNKDWCNCNGSEWNRAQFYYPRLISLSNGYGGVITAEYSTLDGGYWHALNYRVAGRTVDDGQGGGWREVYVYSDDNRGRCYLASEDATQCKWPDQFGTSTGALFLGYREATVTFQDRAGTTFKREWTRFALPDDPWPLRGRPRNDAVKDPNGTTLREVVNIWNFTPTAGGANFVFLQQQDVTTDGRTARTTYRYDTYGNAVALFEYGATDVTGDERSTHRAFYPNTTAWIVDRLAWENIYEGITENVGGTALKTQTLHYYDGATGYTTPPTRGLRTRVDRGLGSWGWVITRYGYNALGNLTVITDTREFTTTFTYDSWFQVYRLEERNALSHLTRYEYYGLNESDPGVGSGLVGALKRVVDANGAATVYTYDAFGRLTKVVRPGDTVDLPTTRYEYRDSYPWLEVPNGGFETGDYWFEYDPSNIQTYQYDTSQFRGGSRSLKIVTSSTADHWVGHNGVTGWQAGRAYWLSAYVKTTSSGQFCLNLSAKAGHEVSVGCVTATANWQIVQGAVTLPADATQFLILLRTPQVGTVYVDDVRVGSLLEVGVYVKEDAAGNTRWGRQVYDGLGRLVQEQTEKDGNQAIIVHRGYDARGLLARQSLPVEVTSAPSGNKYLPPVGNEVWTSYSYDALGRVLIQTNPDNTKIEHHYGVADGMIYDDVIDPNRHRKQYRYDAFGRLARVYEISGDCGNYWGYNCGGQYNTPWAVYATTNYTYNVLDNLTVVTDSVGNTTTMTYDALGRKTQMTDPDMGTWSYTYDTAGNLKTQTDAKGQVLWFNYDALNRILEKRQTNATGTLLASYTYDTVVAGQYNKGRLVKVERPGVFTREWGYDARGRVISEKLSMDGKTWTTSYTYDAMDRVTTITLPDGEVVNHTYNAQALPATVYGTNSYLASAGYDALDRLTSMTYGNNAQTTYDYYDTGSEYDDVAGTYYSYRLKNITVSGSSMNLTHKYDKGGNVKNIVDNLDGSKSQTFDYDFLDRLTSATGVYGSKSYTYNVIGNILTKDGHTYSYSGSTHRVTGDGTYTYGYDNNGNITSRSDGRTYEYDWENRLTAVKANGVVLESYVYDHAGARIKKVEGARVTYYVNPYYEEEQRKLVFFSKRDNTYGEIYTMNADGSGLTRLTNNSVEDSQPAWSPDGKKIAFFSKRDHANGEIYVMNADGTNVVRLTNNTAVDKDPAWSPDGMKIAFASWVSGSGDIYVVPASGGTATKLTGADSAYEDSWPAWSPDGSKIAFYSARSGSGDIYVVPASGGTATKLTGADSTSQDAQPAWKPDGTQIAFRSARSGAGDVYMVSAAGGTATKLGGNHASYDDAHPVWPAPGSEVLFASWRAGGGDLYKMPASSTGSATALSGNHTSAEDSHPDWQGGVSYPSSNTIKHYFVNGQRIATRDSEGLKFNHVDHLRSTSRTTNPSGTVIRTIRYDPWGYTQASWGSGTAVVKYTYTGKELDAGTGLYYYGARYYDAALGRFIQADPVIPNFADSQALNRYSYVRNNPLRYIDPTGHFPIDWLIDVASIAFDVYQLYKQPSWGNVGWLALDIVLWAAPYTPAGAGPLAKGASKADETLDVAKGAARVAAREALITSVRTELQGIRGSGTLLKYLEHGTEAQKIGAAFEAERALHYAREGALEGIEVFEKIETGSGAKRAFFDLVLSGNRVVEAKDWTGWAKWGKETRATRLGDLFEQLQKYMASSKQVILEWKGELPPEVYDRLQPLIEQGLQITSGL